MNRLHYCLLLLAVSITPHLHAQGGWLWHPYQYFGTRSSTHASIYGQGEYQLSSNRISNRLMAEAVFRGRVQSETSDAVLGWDPSATLRIQGSTNGSMWFRSRRTGAWRWFAGAGFNELLAGSLRNGLVQLYLKGNAPFEGQRIDLGPSSLQYHSYQFVGGGFEHEGEAFTWGLGTKVIKTSRYYNIRLGQSSLYTAPYGTSIETDIDLDYEAAASWQPKAEAWYGTGFALSGYMVYHGSEKTLLALEVQDAGLSFFEGVTKYQMQDTHTYTGIEVENILELDDDLVSDGDLDSVEAILGLTEGHSPATAMLPAFVRFHFIYDLGRVLRVSASLKQYFLFGIPELQAGLCFRLNEWLAVQPVVRAGGFTRFDYGLGLAVQPVTSLQLMVQVEQFENLIAPQESTGQYLFVGGQLAF